MKEQVEQVTQQTKEAIQQALTNYYNQTGVLVTSIEVRAFAEPTFSGVMVSIPVDGIKLKSTI
jgi:uncharacterized phage protein gp47/JayE